MNIHDAARNGHTEAVALLLAKGAKVEAADNNGNTPLIVAAREGHTETVALLLEKGANIEAADKYGNTPLILAAWEGHTEAVALLLAKGANIEAADNDGDTPLIWAAREGRTEAVALLLANGAKVEAANNCGDTPLILAAGHGHTETVELLKKHIANLINCRPMTIAEELQMPEFATDKIKCKPFTAIISAGLHLIAIDPAYAKPVATAQFKRPQRGDGMTGNDIILERVDYISLEALLRSPGTVITLENHARRILVIERQYLGKNAKVFGELCYWTGRVVQKIADMGFEVVEAPVYPAKGKGCTSWLQDVFGIQGNLPNSSTIQEMALRIAREDNPYYLWDEETQAASKEFKFNFNYDTAMAYCMGMWWIKKNKF